MLRKLIKMAGKLDSLGLTKEADSIDALIIKVAQIEDVPEEISGDDASERVAKAISNSIGMAHFNGAFKTTNPSSESEGSTFLESQDADSLSSATWSVYNHPDVKSPVIAFKADIPGYFGLVNLEKLDATTSVEIVKAHKGAAEEAVCLVSLEGISRPQADFTTILLGPGGDKGEIVLTFFPGPPIQPSATVWTQELAGGIRTAGDALSAGFKWAKLTGG